jgi:hypothetical protein
MHAGQLAAERPAIPKNHFKEAGASGGHWHVLACERPSARNEKLVGPFVLAPQHGSFFGVGQRLFP